MQSTKRLAVVVLVVTVVGVGAALAAQGHRPQGPPAPEPFGMYLDYSAAVVFNPSIKTEIPKALLSQDLEQFG